MSTDFIYAGKEYYKSYQQEKNTQKGEHQKRGWQEGINGEIRIMMDYLHVSMIWLLDEI